MYLGVDATTRWPRDAAAEHKAIFDAVVARDADLAVQLLQAHNRRTAEIDEASWAVRAAKDAAAQAAVAAVTTIQ